MLDLSIQLDDTVLIDGKKYDVDMSYDNILRLLDMLNDKELDDIEQIVLGLQLLLDTQLKLPLDRQETVFYEVFTQLIGRGKTAEASVDIEGNPMPHKDQAEGERVYSLKQDANYIYASFMQDYGIDLFEVQGELHWYKFQALLEGLSKGTKFKEVLEIRTMELPSGKNTGKQREAIKKAKKAYELKNKP